jgi:hypothetical protein
VRTFFRLHPAGEEPEGLLHPARQRSEAWSPQRLGPCDKCGGSGQTVHECESCKASGPDDNCPACHGEVRYLDTCPACEGSGEIDETARDGVSVFPTEEGLYRYVVKRDADLEDSVIVELKGVPASDDDFDADHGALLVHPKQIVDSRPIDRGRIESLKAELNE